MYFVSLYKVPPPLNLVLNIYGIRREDSLPDFFDPSTKKFVSWSNSYMDLVLPWVLKSVSHRLLPQQILMAKFKKSQAVRKAKLVLTSFSKKVKQDLLRGHGKGG